MNVIWAQKWKGPARKTREGSGRVSPLRSVFFLAPIFHAIQSNNLVIVDHFKVYAFPVLKAIKYSCNINVTFSALKVAIVKLRAQFGNQHISLLASSLFMVRIRATERRRFAGWKWKFQWEIVASTLFLSPPLSRTLPWVTETFLARFPVSVKSFSRLRPTTEDASAFGQQREFPPHAWKKSGTQGNRTRVSFCVVVSRDLSRLPQIMESLFAGYMGSS